MSAHAMTPADAAWLHMDRPTNAMVVNGVLWFDEPLDWDRCRDAFRDRLVARFDRFRQRVVEAPTGPRWQDFDDFDLSLHLHHVALPAPGDRRALEDFVGDRVAAPLDRTRPLWEAYLIDGFGAGSALLMRIHHSVADGIALARVLLSLTDGGEPDGVAPAPGEEHGNDLLGFARPAARVAGALAHQGIETLRHPHHAGQLAAAAIEDARTLAKLLAPGSDPRTAIKGDQHAAHRVAWSDPIQLWRVKRTAGALGATINDVLVAAVAGALGDYLRQRGDEVEQVRAMVPFNLRPLDRPLPRELGNRFGLVLLELPVAVEDPIERVAEVKRRMDAIKHGHEGALSFGILNVLGRTPAAVEARLVDFFSAKGSMVLTNVPGPRRPLSFCGARLSGVLVWAPCSGTIGMSISVFSYGGDVTVGFLTDAGLVPQPQELADGVRRELAALGRLAAATAS
jgi:WS/DGAT/MGAT family acyltransferase